MDKFHILTRSVLNVGNDNRKTCCVLQVISILVLHLLGGRQIVSGVFDCLVLLEICNDGLGIVAHTTSCATGGDLYAL